MFLAEAFDIQIESSDRKLTGLYKLTEKEKLALSRWIENHYVLREQPLHTPLNQPRPHVAQIQNMGRHLILSDGSRWDIDPKDAPIALGWFNPEPLILEELPSGKVKITHSLTGSSIQGNKVAPPS